MTISARRADDGKQVNIAVSGRFDFRVHDDFRKAYENAPERGGSYVVDLGATEYIDSSALGMLLMLNDRARESGVKLEVRNCAEGVRRVLQIANLHKIMAVS